MTLTLSLKDKDYIILRTNINSIEVYMAGRCWMPLVHLTVAGVIDRRRWPTKAKAKASPTKRQSPVKRLERQITSSKGPDSISNANTYQTPLKVCKKWGAELWLATSSPSLALATHKWRDLYQHEHHGGCCFWGG